MVTAAVASTTSDTTAIGAIIAAITGVGRTTTITPIRFPITTFTGVGTTAITTMTAIIMTAITVIDRPLIAKKHQEPADAPQALGVLKVEAAGVEPASRCG
jgi:hypothetical protein